MFFLAGISDGSAGLGDRVLNLLKQSYSKQIHFLRREDDYRKFNKRYDWKNVDFDEPNCEFYKFGEAWGLGNPLQASDAVPVAPRTRFLVPNNVRGARYADNEEGETRMLAGLSYWGFSNQGFLGGELSGLNWFGEASRLRGSVRYSTVVPHRVV